MTIDPHAWLLTLPLTVVFLHAALQPEHSAMKRLWREATRLERHAMECVAGVDVTSTETARRVQRGVMRLAIGALALVSLASLAAFAGVL